MMEDKIVRQYVRAVSRKLKLVILSRLQNNCWKALTRLKLLLASASIDLSLLS